MVSITAGIFILAVLFSMIPGIGLYIALGLLVVGCFSTIALRISRESSSKDEKIAVQDPDDLFA
jgi:hypothetical protein